MRHPSAKSSAEQPNQHNSPCDGERAVTHFLDSALEAMKRESPYMASSIARIDELLRSVML